MTVHWLGPTDNFYHQQAMSPFIPDRHTVSTSGISQQNRRILLDQMETMTTIHVQRARITSYPSVYGEILTYPSRARRARYELPCPPSLQTEAAWLALDSSACI
jgi:hypothetical protein